MPKPELNPLRNPVLGAHMGRWAEVYFTSPPERREAAVQELLRELESEEPGKDPAPVPSLHVPESESITGIREGGMSAAVGLPHDAPPESFLVTCAECGGANVLGQKFCGMCGALLHSAASATGLFEHSSVATVESPWEDSSSADRQEFSERRSSAAYDQVPSRFDSRETESLWPARDDYAPDFSLGTEPVPYRYRLYVGTALAVLLSALIYIAWRGTDAFSSRGSHQAAPVVALPNQPSDSAASSQPPANPAANAAPPKAESPAPAAANPEREQPPQTQRRPLTPADRAQTAAPVPASVSERIAPPDPRGTEALAMGERYLRGSSAAGRNSSEAAQWLWKAVAKQNADATLLLSDLYLRGDGVAKNCDQARLLLDVAARKGKSGAAQRLRNLQAFGCQ